MTVNSKLAQVLGYLIKNDEEKAKELLHEVIIEKARGIHEEMMSHDDEDMAEEVGGTGDMSKDFTNEVTGHHEDDMEEEISTLEDEIDFEETMSEDDAMEADAEMDMDMDKSDEDHEDGDSHEEHEEIMDKMSDLESALAELRAEFEKLESEEAGEDHDEEGEEEGEEEEESWHMDEDFDEIAESLDLEVVTKDMEKSVPAKDVGAASSGMSDGNQAKSPLPKSQTSRFGAKPVETHGEQHKGYDMETAPKHSMDALKKADPDMKADNRRKTSTQGMSKQSKEGNKPEAALNKTAREFGADTVGKMSPLSKGGDNLK